MSHQLPPAGGIPPPGATPPEDAAARFRKTLPPGHAQASQPPANVGDQGNAAPSSSPPAEAPPRAQSLGRLLEETLTAPVRPFGLFGELAREKPPGYALLLANALIFAVLMFAVNLVSVAVSQPAALARYNAPLAAVVAAVGLTLAALGGFAAAGLLHLAALLCGGGASFARSYQAVSMSSGIALLWALLGHLPAGWALTLAWGAFVACAAVERLHAAPALRARAVFAGLATVALLGAWSVKLAAERFLAPYRMMAEQARGIRDIQQTIQRIQPVEGSNPAQETSAQAQQRLFEQLHQLQMAQPESKTADTAAPSRSGLDLIQQQGLPPEAAAPQVNARQLQEVNKAAAGMVQSVLPLLNNPALTKGMPPEQAKQLEGLTQMLQELQGNLQSGKPMTPEQQRRLMQQYQQAMIRLLAQPPTPVPRPKPETGEQRRP